MQAASHSTDDHVAQARIGIRDLRLSQIREIVNASAGVPGILPFWQGEPDLPTPNYICEAAIAELRANNTRYAPTVGLIELREALALYMNNLREPIDVQRIAVTSSGTSSLMLALQAVIGPGSKVVAVTPVWPNLCEMPKLIGAELTTVALDFTARGWQLDLDRLLDAITPDIEAVIINSPNNPTGWTLSRIEQEAIVAHCRKTGTWIIADDVYERVMLDGGSAPSFLDIMSAKERLISCNSFSKAWRMTGWRLGWVVLPDGMLSDFSKILEYNTTCTPPFVQRAGIVALAEGEPDLRQMVAHLHAGQRRLHALLASVPGVVTGPPAPGGMYSFFRIEGHSDPYRFCKEIVDKVGLGLAPGTAFGDGGDGFIRWCFANSEARIVDGVDRLRAFLDA